MRLHAVAAKDLQFIGHDPIHGDIGVLVVADHQADLNVPAALAQVGDGVEAGGRAAQCVDGDMRAAAGDLLDLLSDIR